MYQKFENSIILFRPQVEECRPVERVRGRGKLPRALRRLGAPPSIKYTGIHHLENLKKFLARGASRECFPGPRSGSRRA